MKQKLTEPQIKVDRFTIRNFSIPSSIIESVKSTENKLTEDLNNSINQLDPIVSFIEHSPQQQNTHSFQMRRECLPN